MGIMDVQMWLRAAKIGQPAHRDNLADEGTSRGVLFGLSRATLQAAPQLAQAATKEQALTAQVQARNTPRMAPPSFGPGSGPPSLGLGRFHPKGPDGATSTGGTADDE